MSVLPQPTAPKSGGFQQESNTFSTMGDLFRFFAPKKVRFSKVSPPVLNKDITEGEMIIDKTALRLYFVVDQTLRYVALT
jgi:hypothetical protein